MSEVAVSRAAADHGRLHHWRAPGLHFLCGIAIAGTLGGMLLLEWYPWPLFQADGRGLLPAAGLVVAMLAGPPLAFALSRFRPTRWRFDLTIIALLQAAALVHALNESYLARPVYLVFTIDRFDLVGASDLDPGDVAQVTRAEFMTVPDGGVRYAAAVMPRDAREQQRVLFSSLEGKDLNLYPQHYVAYAEQVPNVLKRAQGLDVLIERDAAAVRGYLQASGRRPESVKFLPLRARGTDGAVLLDAASGSPLKILLIDPW